MNIWRGIGNKNQKASLLHLVNAEAHNKCKYKISRLSEYKIRKCTVNKTTETKRNVKE